MVAIWGLPWDCPGNAQQRGVWFPSQKEQTQEHPWAGGLTEGQIPALLDPFLSPRHPCLDRPCIPCPTEALSSPLSPAPGPVHFVHPPTGCRDWVWRGSSNPVTPCSESLVAPQCPQGRAGPGAVGGVRVFHWHVAELAVQAPSPTLLPQSPRRLDAAPVAQSLCSHVWNAAPSSHLIHSSLTSGCQPPRNLPQHHPPNPGLGF